MQFDITHHLLYFPNQTVNVIYFYAFYTSVEKPFLHCPVAEAVITIFFVIDFFVNSADRS